MRPFPVAIALAVVLSLCPRAGAADDLPSLFEQGLKAYETRSYAAAELIFGTIVESKNDVYRDRAWFHLALSIYHQGRYSAALFELNRFLLMCQTQTLAVRAQFWVAECLRQMKRALPAIEEYKRFIARYPGDDLAVVARERIGDIYFSEGRYDEAVIEWERVIPMNADRSRRLRIAVKIGEAQFWSGRDARALETLAPALDSMNDARLEARARIVAGRAYQRQNRHQDAIRQFSRVPSALAREAPYSDAQYFIALSYYAEGDARRAWALLEEFIGIGLRSDWFFDALYMLGRINIEEGSEAEGMRLLEQVRSGTGKPELKARAALLLSRIYLRKNPRQAIPYLEDVTSIPDPAEQKNALMLLGRAYMAERRYDNAERTLDLAESRFPYDPVVDEIRFLKAGIAIEKGDFERGISALDDIARTNPFSRFINESLYYRALADHRRGAHATARTRLQRYLGGAHPERGFAATALLIEVHVAQKNYPEAERSALSLAARFPDHAGLDSALCALARRLSAAGRDGERYYRLVMERYPASPCACVQARERGDRAIDRREFALAEEQYGRFLKHCAEETSGEVFAWWAQSIYRQGRFAEVAALGVHERFQASEGPARSALAILIAQSMYRQGDYGGAHRYFTIVGREGLRDDERHEYVIACAAVEDFEGLGGALATLERNKPLYRRSLSELGRFFRGAGNVEMAKTYYQWYLLEEPAKEPSDTVRLILAEIGAEQGDYASAIVQLNDITTPSLLQRQLSLLIVAYFRSGNIASAVALSERYGADLVASRAGEAAVRENVQYYFHQDDWDGFERYALLLRRFPGNEAYLEYHEGLLALRLGEYPRARRIFERLGDGQSNYRDEAVFLSGMIAQYAFQDVAGAMKIFNRLTGGAGSTTVLADRARIHLAVLAFEAGRPEESRRYLDAVLASSKSDMDRTRARNLLEYFRLAR